MPKLTVFFSILFILLITTFAKGQDPHFAGEQEMNTWYNPALKVNKIAAAHINIRNVKYPGIISYTSQAATIELPLVSNKDTVFDNISFAHLAAGINMDNAGDKFMKASTAMLAFSYALPLSDDNTYIALGIQGNYSFNQVGTGDSYRFPAQFDKYGALGWSMAMDPFGSGYNYGYFTAGIGVAVFHNSDLAQWYIGASVRHLNHPYTEWNYAARLPSCNGIQSGYSAYISRLNEISCYGNLTWQAGTITQTMTEQFIGARYTHHLGDSTANAFSLGVSLRAGDALIPGIGVQIRQSRFALYYEIDVSGGNYHRRAFDLSYKLNLVKP